MINGHELDHDQIKAKMLEQTHTRDERMAFYNKVMHEDMPAEDQEITQDLIDELIG